MTPLSFYQNFVNGVASTIYAAAWPTASYRSAALSGISPRSNGADIAVRLYGISAFDQSSLWTDVVIQVRNGAIKDISWGSNNAFLARPGETLTAMSGLAAELTQDLQRTSTNTSPQGYGYVVKNNCKHPIRLAIQYQNMNGLHSSLGWWTVKANEEAELHAGGNKIKSKSDTWYFYAEASDSTSYVWKGRYLIKVGDRQLGMQRLVDKEGKNELSLSCT